MVGAYQFLKKYGVALGFGFGAVLSVLTWMIIVIGYPDFNPTEEELYGLGIFDFGLYTTYLLLIVGSIVAAVFPIIYVAKHPKESMKGLVALAVLVVLFVITNLLGDGTLTLEMIKSDETLMPIGEMFLVGQTQSSAVGFADGLIKFSYIMMLLSIGAIMFAVIRDFVKQQ
jgi:hypothetical protein